MRFFVCLIHPDGGAIPDTVRGAYEALPRSRGLAFDWHAISRHACILIGGDATDAHQSVATEGDYAAVGIANLDNRDDLVRWSGRDGQNASDLELVLRTVARHGTTYIPRFLGDFAFLVWDGTTRTVVAATDPFAIKRMYYAQRNGVLAFSSRAEALALEERYDAHYLAELVAACPPSAGLTVYASVNLVPAASMVVISRGRTVTQQYWSPYDFNTEPACARSEREAAETCRNLLAESVRLRLTGGDATWANLSGGMDSSSVVSLAQWLAANGTIANGLGGTVTYVDSHGTGADEQEYSNAVASRWHVRNEKIIDPPVWVDGQCSAPCTDARTDDFVFYPRDRRVCAILYGAGGRVLLTGGGGDMLFSGNMLFFADWIAGGRLAPALHEMARRAAIGRVSFWELAYHNALVPILPRSLQHRLMRELGQVPPWMPRATVRRYDLDVRTWASFSFAGSIGDKYRHCVAAGVAAVPGSLPLGVIQDTVDVRHPFLYRPLVEFALRLPPELCARPYARKWILREAMRGVLPEVVRTRVGKGALYGRIAWSLGAQRAILEPLIRDSMLADLGVVDPTHLQVWFKTAQNAPDSREKRFAHVQHTLGIEAWLQTRSGRWPRGSHFQ
jgi:asparagine synthase (glutamine-hydrolysing)